MGIQFHFASALGAFHSRRLLSFLCSPAAGPQLAFAFLCYRSAGKYARGKRKGNADSPRGGATPGFFCRRQREAAIPPEGEARARATARVAPTGAGRGRGRGPAGRRGRRPLRRWTGVGAFQPPLCKGRCRPASHASRVTEGLCRIRGQRSPLRARDAVAGRASARIRRALREAPLRCGRGVGGRAAGGGRPKVAPTGGGRTFCAIPHSEFCIRIDPLPLPKTNAGLRRHLLAILFGFADHSPSSQMRP